MRVFDDHIFCLALGDAVRVRHPHHAHPRAQPRPPRVAAPVRPEATSCAAEWLKNAPGDGRGLRHPVLQHRHRRMSQASSRVHVGAGHCHGRTAPSLLLMIGDGL